MWFSTISAILTIILYTITLQISCGNKSIVGVTDEYPALSYSPYSEDNLDNECNSQCNCNTGFYEPICLNDQTYFSPCYAGCEVKNETENSFSMCSCVADNSDVATLGECEDEDDCATKSISFLALMFFVIFFEFLPPTIVPIATLRSVDPKLKSLSMGLQWNILRLLGTIPGPIALGAMLDKACTIWQETCGELGSCWIYDDNKIYSAIMYIRE